MAQRDPRVDAYIAKSAEFARPVLQRLRAAVHKACPDVGETIKWGMPFFVHAGGILCNMAAFKQHVSFGFWKHALVMGEDVQRDGMGSFGRMTSLADVPPDKVLLPLIQQAMRLNETGVRAAGPRKAAARPVPKAPPDLLAALKQAPAALAHFKAFSPSQQREYVDWVIEAKRDETRQRRISQAVEWLGEGKPRNWKYMDAGSR